MAKKYLELENLNSVFNEVKKHTDAEYSKMEASAEDVLSAINSKLDDALQGIGGGSTKVKAVNSPNVRYLKHGYINLRDESGSVHITSYAKLKVHSEEVVDLSKYMGEMDVLDDSVDFWDNHCNDNNYWQQNYERLEITWPYVKIPKFNGLSGNNGIIRIGIHRFPWTIGSNGKLQRYDVSLSGVIERKLPKPYLVVNNSGYRMECLSGNLEWQARVRRRLYNWTGEFDDNNRRILIKTDYIKKYWRTRYREVTKYDGSKRMVIDTYDGNPEKKGVYRVRARSRSKAKSDWVYVLVRSCNERSHTVWGITVLSE